MNSHKQATRAQLTQAMGFIEPHLRPIVAAVRDHRVSMMFVPQIADPFRKPRGDARPLITIIGDDHDAALGPKAFHMPSLRRAVRASSSFAVVSSAARVDVYSSVAIQAAALRQDVVLIETRPEQEIAWLALIQKLAPGRHITLATVKGGHA